MKIEPIPLYKRRNPSLGRYTGTRKDWRIAWSRARSGVKAGIKPDPKDTGLLWKASLIAAHDAGMIDELSLPVASRLEAMQMVNEILSKREATQ